jgi:hypothetical protein
MIIVGLVAILLYFQAKHCRGLLAYYHCVRRFLPGLQYKIAPEIAKWLFLLGPTTM